MVGVFSRARAVTARKSAVATAVDPLEKFQVGVKADAAFAGYQVAHVETFNGTLADHLISPSNPYGRLAHNFSERDRRQTSTTSVGSLADPYWTGFRDANDGVMVSSFSDIVSVSNGVITTKCRHATSGEILLTGPRTTATGPATTERRMLWGHPTLLGAFAVRGPRIIELRWRYNTPYNYTGTNANPGMAIWELNVRGGSEQGSTVGVGEINDEFDWIEYHISGGQVNNRYAFNLNDYNVQPPLLNQWQTSRVTYTDSSITVQKVSDAGVILATNTVINSAKNLSQLFYLMFGVINITVQSGSFDDSLWTSVSQTLEVAAIRVWTPLAAETLSPPTNGHNGTPIALNLGGTSTLTLPSQVSLWGKAVDGEYFAWVNAYDTNGPGRSANFTAPLETRDNLPVGVTYDAPSRTFTFGATFSTQPGVILLYVYAYTSTSGVSKPYRQAVYVRPKLALPPLPAATAGGAFSTTIARVDGSSVRYWDNGNCPLGTSHGLSMVSASSPAWLSFDPATRVLSGTVPGGFSSDSVTWRCTNGAGYTTDQVQPIATVADVPLNSIAGYIYSWDTTNTTSTPDDGAGKVAQLKDVFDATKSIGRTLSTGRPTISTTGGPASNKRVMVFTTAAAQFLRSSEGANSATLAAFANNASITASASVIYTCYAAKADATGIQRILGWFRNDNYIQYRHGASDRGLSWQTASASTGSSVQASQDINWHVIEWLKDGATVTVRIDGTQIATGTIVSTGALSTTDFVMGANYVSSTLTAGFNGQIGPGWIGSAIPSTGNQTIIKNWVAGKMGITVV